MNTSATITLFWAATCSSGRELGEKSKPSPQRPPRGTKGWDGHREPQPNRPEPLCPLLDRARHCMERAGTRARKAFIPLLTHHHLHHRYPAALPLLLCEITQAHLINKQLFSREKSTQKLTDWEEEEWGQTPHTPPSENQEIASVWMVRFHVWNNKDNVSENYAKQWLKGDPLSVQHFGKLSAHCERSLQI